MLRTLLVGLFGLLLANAVKIVDVSTHVILKDIPFDFSFVVEYDKADILLGGNLLFASLFRNGSNEMVTVASFNQSIWQPNGRQRTHFFFEDSSTILSKTGKDRLILRVNLKQTEYAYAEQDVWVISGSATLLPLLLILAIAIGTQSVLPALFAGVWFTAFLTYENNIAVSLARALDTLILGSLTNPENQLVILFAMVMGGFIQMVNDSGGALGLGNSLSNCATTARSAQLSTLFFGLLLFFDDYASALVVGATMGRVMDRNAVSREKFAFIVDSGAAPIAALIPITSWTAFESSLLQVEANKLVAKGISFGALGFEESGFQGLLRMLKYAYYSIFLLVFQVVLIVSKREFGPMFFVELKARKKPVQAEVIATTAVLAVDEEEKQTDDDSLLPPVKSNQVPPARCLNAFIPILFFILLVVSLMIAQGIAPMPAGEDVPFGANSIEIMYIGAVVASMFAAVLYRFQVFPAAATNDMIHRRCWKMPLRSCSNSMHSFVEGFSHLTPTIMILVLAWSIGTAVDELGAGRYFANSLEGKVSPNGLPALIFFISCIVAFCTGSSWGTMALLFPICGPVAFRLSLEAKSTELYYCSMAAILEGSVFGDHCSFISDTTIMCSMACKCPITQHVKTQIPYAIFIALISLASGFAGIGTLPLVFTYLLGTGLIILGVLTIGASPDKAEEMDLLSRVYCFVQVRIFRVDPEKIELLRLLHRRSAVSSFELSRPDSSASQPQTQSQGLDAI